MPILHKGVYNTMKDVKFKVWDKILHSWSKNTHRFLHNEGVLTLDSGDRYDFVQWTGLLDRHGVEIYEGDIVKWTSTHSGASQEMHTDKIVSFGLGKWHSRFDFPIAAKIFE